MRRRDKKLEVRGERKKERKKANTKAKENTKKERKKESYEEIRKKKERSKKKGKCKIILARRQFTIWRNNRKIESARQLIGMENKEFIIEKMRKNWRKQYQLKEEKKKEWNKK